MARFHRSHQLRSRPAFAPSMALIVLAAALGGHRSAGAQCEEWKPITGTLDAPAKTLAVWNGSLIVGGHFSAVNGPPNLTVNQITRRDAAGWHQFVSGGGGQIGLGGNGTVYGLAEWNGELVAAGSFTTAGGQTVNNVARWDGADWQTLASPGGQVGVNATVRALATWNGNITVGGAFTTAGGQAATHIARWDGKAWHALTSNGQNGISGPVYALAEWNGDLIAGGTFVTAGNQTVNNIARWDGTAWHPLTSNGQIGVGGPNPVLVYALCSWNGDLIAGGTFATAGGQTVNRIARWDGTAWHPLTSGSAGMNDAVYALTVWDDNLLAGGAFTMAGAEPADNRVALWDGESWQPLSSGGQPTWTSTDALTIFHGAPVAGPSGPIQATTLKRWACDGDVNFDGIVDIDDLLAVINAWGPCPPKQLCDADIAPALTDGDGQVDIDDLLLLINNWD
jgi:hypothetical protein